MTVDGRPQRSCILTVSAAQHKDVRTIEVLDESSVGARVQAAWLKLNVIECGYCQSGQMVSAAALLAKYPKPDDAQIDDAMSGNICRCGTHVRIRAAIHEAASS